MKTYQLRVFQKGREVPMLQFMDESGKLIDERPLDREDVDQFSKEMEEGYRNVAPGLTTLGNRLYEWVDDPTQRWLDRIVNDPEGLALHIDVDEKFRHLPWELMASRGNHLCVNPLRPFTPVRRVTHNVVSTEIANRPLRVLFMATSPEGVTPVLNFEAEEGMILQGTREQGIELIVEESGTLEGLQFIVESFGTGYFDVVHLSGHADVVGGEPRFVMENDVGLREDATAEAIAGAFQRIWPRLIFLSGCNTGKAPDQGWVPSMSEILVSVGAPAVLGWALPVGDMSANILASSLYSYLATGDRLDEGVAKARQQLYKNKSPYWHLLRLYSDATPLTEIVTRTRTPGRLPMGGRQASEDFLDASGKKKVASREAFVGRRRQIQRCLRAMNRSDASGDMHEGILLHGMGGLGKSTLASRICERMNASHQRAVWIGKIDEGEVLKLPGKLTLPSVEMEVEANKALNTPTVSLERRLHYVFSGAMATIPCLFVLDDFEDGNLEETFDGGHILTSDASEVLSSLLCAIRSSNSQSRVLITSRYRFPIPKGYNVYEEGLESMRGHELDKKLQLSSNLRTDSETDHALKDRAIGTSAGNPRLLEWLDLILSDKQTNHDAILSAMELKAEELREDVLAATLVEAQKPALRRLLALVNVFDLPVPLDAVRAVAGDIPLESHLERAISLGLMEAGVDPFERERRYLVSNVLEALITDEINDEERKQACGAGARSLLELWA